MGLSIREKGDVVATFRFVAVRLMETLAGWVPSTPELEAKALFGRHLWDLAQHADLLGRRTAELRLALHHSRPPVSGYREVLAALDGLQRTGDRFGGAYDAVLPDVARRYEGYLRITDRLLDEPTVRILEGALTDLRRMGAERDALLAERPDLAPRDHTSVRRISALAVATADFVDYRVAGSETVGAA